MTKKTKSRKKKLPLQWVDETFEVTLKRRPSTDTRFLRNHPVVLPLEQPVFPIPLP